MPIPRLPYPFAPRVNNANPLARGLVFLTLPGVRNGIDLVRNVLPTRTGYSSIASRYGTAAKMATGSGNCLNYGAYAAIPGASPGAVFTIAALAAPVSASRRANFFFQGDISGSPFAQNFLAANCDQNAGSTAGKFALIQYAGGFEAQAESTAGMVDGGWHVFLGRKLPGNANPNVWRDGVDVTGSSVAPTYTASAYAGVSACGQTGDDIAPDYPVALVAVWARVLSQAEIVTFSRDPWQLLEPFPARKYFGAGATGTSATIAAVESSDTTAITAANWDTAQIAATESSDLAALTASATTGAAIAGTESPDTAAVNVAVWVTAQLGALESTDSASITAANWQTAQIAATESSDLAAISAAVTIGAAIGATESSDVASILAEGNASITSAFIAGIESPDTAALDATVTTGASIAAAESADVADITSATVVTAQIAGTESPDVTAISTGGTAVEVPSVDGRQKYRRQKPLVLPAVVVTVAAVAAVESPDLANIQAGIDQAYVDFRRRLEIERDDMELLLEL